MCFYLLILPYSWQIGLLNQSHEEHFMLISYVLGNKTKEGVVSGVNTGEKLISVPI